VQEFFSLPSPKQISGQTVLSIIEQIFDVHLMVLNSTIDIQENTTKYTDEIGRI
jgi:hypothetical protein